MCLKKKPCLSFSGFPIISLFPCDECPFIKHCCTAFSQRHGMIMICALYDYCQADILEALRNLKVLKTTRAVKVDSQ